MLLICPIYFLKKDALNSILDDLHIWGRLFLCAVCIFRCFSLIGFTIVGATAAHIYNFHEGFVLFFFGSMIGAVFQYYAVRKKWIKIPGESILRKAPSPKSALGIVLVRVCPIFPFDLVTIRLAYDRKTSFGQFLQGTLIGSLPWFISICMAGAQAGRETFLVVIAFAGQIFFGILLLLLVLFLFLLLAWET